MTGWLHTANELEDLTAHTDADIRRWAVDRWIALYPEHGHETLGHLLLDPDPYLARRVAMFLARTGDAHWEPVFRRGLELAAPEDRMMWIEALGRLGVPSTVAYIGASIRQARSGHELVAWIQALGSFRTDTALAILQPLLNLVKDENALGGTLSRILLDNGSMHDIREVVRRWHAWPAAEAPHILSAMLDWLGVDIATREALTWLPSEGPVAVWDQLAQRHVASSLDARTLHDAWEQGAIPFAKACRSALHNLLHARGHDPAAWIHDDLGPAREDDRALALGADALLGTLSSTDTRPHQSSIAALAALLTVERRPVMPCDTLDQAWVAFDAPRAVIDPAVRAFLEADQEASFDGLVARIDHPAPWVRTRAVKFLGAAWPASEGVVRANLPKILRTELQQPFPAYRHVLRELLTRCGTDAVDAALAAIDTTSRVEHIALLGQVPTDATLAQLVAFLGEPHAAEAASRALCRLGDRRAIEPLAGLWRRGRVEIAAILDLLCRLTDTEHEAADAWRADIDRGRGRAALSRATLLGPPAEC